GCTAGAGAVPVVAREGVRRSSAGARRDPMAAGGASHPAELAGAGDCRRQHRCRDRDHPRIDAVVFGTWLSARYPDLGPHPVRCQRLPGYRPALGVVSRRGYLSRGADDQLYRRRAARRARPAQSDVTLQNRPGNRPGEHLLEIRGLKTHFATEDGMVHAVDGVDLAIDRGETLGVVGESGCGKTVTALSVLKLIASPPGRIVAGQILWRGRDLVPLSPDEMRSIRSKEIGIVFQEPMTSLNPVYTVGAQIAETVREH